MEKHPEEWHIHNLEPYAFGLKPDWIKQLRRENQLKNYPIHKVIK